MLIGWLQKIPRAAHRPARRIGHLLSASGGSALAEFALVLPVLVLLLLGGVEIGRYVLLQQKLSRLAANASDLTSRAETLTTKDLDQVMEAAQHIVRPFDLDVGGVVVISSVGRDGTQGPRVNWQRSGPGAAVATSAIGQAGQTARLPQGFVLREDQDVIVAEVFYSYTPFFFGQVTEPQEIYHLAVQRPRFGSLAQLEPLP
jgi:Flp pilus assembly protein TadG